MLAISPFYKGFLMRDKYSGLQIGIHWLVFLLVIGAYAAMELRGFFPRSARPVINMIHVSCGISIFVLMVVRLLVRLKFPAPPIVPKPSPMMTGFAHLGHLVIYLLFIALDTLKAWHELLANTGYFIIGLHALAALLHHYFWKDNTLLRMMPRKR